MRIGHGYDVHRFTNDRKLVIGGVEIPYARGLLGHSDADVLIHAVIDALIGAAGEGDIGRHFPDTSGEFKDILSLKLLRRIEVLLRGKGYRVNNVDSTIVAQEPKLARFIPNMRVNISTVLNVDPSAINVKATTTEGLGFAGRGEGIAAYAVATILEIS